MKKATLVIAITTALFAASSVATAGGLFGDTNNYGGQGGDGGNAAAGAIAGAAAKSSANSRSSASANNRNSNLQGQLQGQAQKQSTDQANSQTIESVDGHMRDTYEKYAPSVNGPSMDPTAPCIVTTSGSVNAPMVGIGYGTGVLDVACEEREIARMAIQSGNEETAAKGVMILDRQAEAVLARFREEDTEATTAAVSNYNSADDTVWAFQDY